MNPKLRDYRLGPTSVDSVRGVLYFRLPQNSAQASIEEATKLRFMWDKNDSLDVDTNPDINKDDSLHLYYRLELVFEDTYYILKDSINHSEYKDSSFIFVDIDLRNDFSFYNDNYLNHLNNATTNLDISGRTQYKWRIVSQNYSDDSIGADPYQVSLGWEETDFTIDLIKPEIMDFDIIINSLYTGYYDIIWESNELLLTDSTYLRINENENQFSGLSQLNIRYMNNQLYNFTGMISNDITSAKINYNLELRDLSMNSGQRADSVVYAILQPNNFLLFSTPSKLAFINIEESNLDEPIGILVTEKNKESLSKIHSSNVYQLTPQINIYHNADLLNIDGTISFDINDYLSAEIPDWQYVIVKINDGIYYEYPTMYDDGIVSTKISEISSC